MTLRTRLQSEQGLTAVELLITLIVAALFLASGYVLYQSVLNRSLENRQRAMADIIATDYGRRYESTIGTSCGFSTPLNNQAVSGVQGLTDVRVTVQISCPQLAGQRTYRITTTVAYGQGVNASSVRQVIYGAQ